MWSEWVGRSLGRYHIESLVGRGAMGVVFRAQDPDLHRTVAIKVLYPHLTADEDLVERFRLEARTAANLRHRNIVAIYDVGFAEDLYYLVMEYLEGISLSAIIDEQGPLPISKLLDISDQVASALDYIHRRKLVHRDIKLTNIMIDPEGRAVLTDFGLVWSAKGSVLTSEGRIMGTPQYIAPEQISGGEIGIWTDLYALGVVIYKMLSGQYPFEADVPAAFLFQVLWESAPLVTELRPQLPEQVDTVIGRALAKEPTERFASGADLVISLRRALDGKVDQPIEMIRPIPARSRLLTTLRALPSFAWALVGVIILLIAGIPFLLGAILPPSGSPTDTPPVIAMTTEPPTATLEQPTALLTATPTPTSLPVVVPTVTPGEATSVPPSATPAATTAGPTQPTGTAVPTDTPAPATAPPVQPTARPAQPTVTPVPPTATPIPPTATPPPPTPTYTTKPTRERPTDTPFPTDTPVTPTDTPFPTDTPVTPTDTPEPTNTRAPTPTNTKPPTERPTVGSP
jgi:serine/threonine-protein kinase